MNHQHDTHIYRTLVAGTCYEIIGHVGTTNTEIYDPPRQELDFKKRSIYSKE